jgi:alanyl-tRNA synthetase
VTHTVTPAIAMVASTVNPPGVVFAQTPPLTSSAGTNSPDMGVMLKQVLSSVGGRGGGTRDFAQGGVPPGCDVEQLLQQAADTIKT